ncbi:UNVERIFIED_CONTAM: hypothetical protein FKN15_007529 [Acipenser sinensis]
MAKRYNRTQLSMFVDDHPDGIQNCHSPDDWVHTSCHYVWEGTPRQKQGRSPKLISAWEGPYPVLKRISDVVYWVQQEGPWRRMVLHQDCLVPYRPKGRHEVDPPSQQQE